MRLCGEHLAVQGAGTTPPQARLTQAIGALAASLDSPAADHFDALLQVGERALEAGGGQRARPGAGRRRDVGPDPGAVQGGVAAARPGPGRSRPRRRGAGVLRAVRHAAAERRGGARGRPQDGHPAAPAGLPRRGRLRSSPRPAPHCATCSDSPMRPPRPSRRGSPRTYGHGSPSTAWGTPAYGASWSCTARTAGSSNGPGCRTRCSAAAPRSASAVCGAWSRGGRCAWSRTPETSPGSTLGAEIDRYDLVVRCDAFRVRAEGTGERTDLHAVSLRGDTPWEGPAWTRPAGVRLVFGDPAAAWRRATRERLVPGAQDHVGDASLRRPLGDPALLGEDGWGRRRPRPSPFSGSWTSWTRAPAWTSSASPCPAGCGPGRPSGSWTARRTSTTAR
ncbi:hypothetical protein LV779_21690 [Streptomyces thinghirensis]|nr:hypothetical protein [Streptomyces thinghirensis]